MSETSAAQITFDLIMEDDMSFVEGCYKLSNKNWEVFIISQEESIEKITVEKEITWQSGNTGVIIKLPKNAKINKINVLKILSNVLDVSAWSEVVGPDSMQLR